MFCIWILSEAAILVYKVLFKGIESLCLSDLSVIIQFKFTFRVWQCSYLKEEWKARQDVVSEDIASRFDDLRFISLEVCDV